MTDGLLVTCLKAVTRTLWVVEIGIRRGFAGLRGPPGYRLAGECRSCAKCCERPSIRGGLATWYLPPLRRLFLGWQRHVNGFELIEADEDAHAFVFRCSHFDWATRRCDSYHSRPFMCRDYPRALLAQPWPDLFPECGHRPIARNAEQLHAALAAQNLAPEKLAELERKLFLK